MRIETEVRDRRVLWITLDAEGGVAAMDPPTMAALAEAWCRLRDDASLRVAVVTGTGERSFCVGSNLKTFIPLLQSGDADPRDNQGAYMKSPVGTVFKPVIAAINGDCLGGGLELLACTDIRFSVAEARFGLPECRWGVFPGGGGTVRLIRQLGYVHAMEIMLTGRMITAAHAARIGLLNDVVAPGELLERARSVALEIAGNGPLAVQRIKESALRSLDVPFDVAGELESLIGVDVFRSPQAAEGLAAFAQKRRPDFDRFVP